MSWKMVFGKFQLGKGKVLSSKTIPHRFIFHHRRYGCECPPLFEGPNCERIKHPIEIITDARIHNEQTKEKAARKEEVITTSIVLFAIVFLVGVLFVLRQVRRIMKRRTEPTTEINLQGFRDEIDEYEDDHFTAFSPNGNMLFPAFGGGMPARKDEIMVLSDIDLT